MISNGCLVAQSACLKYSLRQIVLGIGRRTQARGPSRARWICQSAIVRQEEDVRVERDERQRARKVSGITYRHIHPNGRIIGKPGRRQVQSSEKLASNALGRPAQVVVLRDLVGDKPETPQWETGSTSSLQSAAKGPGLSKQELERALKGEDEPVEQQEVNESIDAMRPEGAAISDAEMQALREELIGGFNMKQLVGYLFKSVGKQQGEGAVSRQDPGTIRVAPWRLGQTPLNRKLDLSGIRNPDAGRSKADIVDQILRVDWHLITETERQQVGEAELRVKQWQIKYLFDIAHEGRNMLDSLLDSPLLSRSCNIQAHRLNSAIRITARQGDANDAIERIKRGLENVPHGTMSLLQLSSLLRPGQKLKDLFAPEDLAFVAERTGTVLEQDGGVMHIYSGLDERRKSLHAKRLLLGLLNLPAPVGRLQLENTVEVIQRNDTQGFAERVHQVPYAVLGAPPRVLSKKWHRNAVPTVDRRKHGIEKDSLAVDEATSDKHSQTLALAVAMKLGQPYQIRNEALNSGIWSLSDDAEWTASLGSLLHHGSPDNPKNQTRKRRNKNSNPIPAEEEADEYFSTQITNIAPLLSHFAPASESQFTTSNLRVHLLPSPFGPKKVDALKLLPRISVDLDLSRASPSPPKVSATLHEQHATLPLPAHASDIRFVRSRRMTAEASSLGQTNGVQQFLSRLLKDLRDGRGYLPANLNIEVPLPWRILRELDEENEARRDVKQTYLVLGYEFVRSANFMPMRQGKRMDADLLEAWSDEYVLRWEEVDGGSSGGRRTEIKVVKASEMRQEEEQGADGEQNDQEVVDANSEGEVEGASAKPESSDSSEARSEGQAVGGRKGMKERQLVDAAFAVVRRMTRAAGG